jgi:hypothetical protein
MSSIPTLPTGPEQFDAAIGALERATRRPVPTTSRRPDLAAEMRSSVVLLAVFLVPLLLVAYLAG